MKIRPPAPLVRAGFATCDSLGWLLHELFGLGPGLYELEKLLDLPRPVSQRAAWASAALTAKNHNLRRLLRHFGSAILEGCVRWHTPPHELRERQHRQQATLLVGWHLGAPFALAQALSQEGLQALFCVGPPPGHRVPPGIEFVTSDGGLMQRSKALHQALHALKKGETVYVVADHPEISKQTVAMWGRPISLAPSLGMLARLGQAQVIPVISSWQRGGWMEVRHFDPLAAASEAEVFQEIGRFFEDYIRLHPALLEEKSLMKLLQDRKSVV